MPAMTKRQPIESDDAIDLGGRSGRVRSEHVRFGYGSDETVIDDLSLTVKDERRDLVEPFRG